MLITTITAPTVEPVTLQEVKDWLRVDHPSDDDLIRSAITSARQYAETATRRQFINATLDIKFEDFCWPTLRMPIVPVSSFTHVKYYDVDNVEQTLSSSNYITTVGTAETPGEIKPAQGYSWPATRATAFHRVTVRVVAGYGAAPENVDHRVKQLVKLLVANAYENREPLITGTIVALLPMSTKMLIDQLKLRRTFA